MEKRHIITASIVVVSLVGMVIFTAPSSHKSINSAPASDNSTEQTASTPTGSSTEQQTTSPVVSSDDLAKQAAQEQAMAKQDEALAQEFLNSGNSYTSPSSTYVPSYTPTSTSGGTSQPTNTCNYSAAQAAVQPISTQLQQNQTAINQAMSEISAYNNAENQAAGTSGINAGAYTAANASALAPVDQELNSLDAQEQNLMTQLKSTEAQYGC